MKYVGLIILKNYKNWTDFCNVADPGCLSRILIYPFRIPDLGSYNSSQRGEGKNFCCPTIYWSHKYHKIVNNCIFEQVNTIFLAETLRIIVLFTQKVVIKLPHIWVWDPRSGKNLLRIPDAGSKGTGYRIRPELRQGQKARDPGSGRLYFCVNKVESSPDPQTDAAPIGSGFTKEIRYWTYHLWEGSGWRRQQRGTSVLRPPLSRISLHICKKYTFK